MDNSKDENIIYSDYEFVHKAIWDARNGWLMHYSGYIEARNGLNYSGMRKYAVQFIGYTMANYSKFKNLGNIDKVKVIYNKLRKHEIINDQELNLLEDFMQEYFDKTQMGNVVAKKLDPGKSILMNR